MACRSRVSRFRVSGAAAWAAAPALERSTALVAAAEALAAAAGEVTDLMVREVGKPVTEASAEVGRGVGILRYYAQQVLDPDGETYPGPGPAALLLARRRPRGVAGLITPWNFPVAIPLWKAAPALAFGNGVVLKAASEATALALRLAELLSPTLPDGLFQVVPGSAATATALIGQADCVSFTGSVEVGRQVAVAATTRGIPCQAEMGGLNASIVLPDADPARAAATIAGAAMGYAGQKCTATSRAIVVGDPGPFTEALVAAVERLPVGDPAEQATVVGPVINEPARRTVVEAAEAAAAAGARLLAGGRASDGDGDCTHVPDIGAFELQGSKVTALATAGAASAQAGQPVSFSSAGSCIPGPGEPATTTLPSFFAPSTTVFHSFSLALLCAQTGDAPTIKTKSISIACIRSPRQ